MRRSKKYLALMLATMMFVTSFTACSKGTKSGAASGDGAISMKIWESENAEGEFIKEACKKYHEKNSNVTINYEHVEMADAPNQIMLDGPAGTGPDLFVAPSNNVGVLAETGAILEISASESDLKDLKVGKSCISAVTQDKKLYGYPISAETYALFYNKDLIDEKEVPKTFDELKTWCKKFNNDKKNKNKYSFMMAPQGYYSVVFTGKDGNRAFGKDGTDTSKTYMAEPSAIEGMKYYQSLRKDVLDIPSKDLSFDTCKGAFEAGNCAMLIDGPWDVANFEKANINMGVTTIPALTDKEKAATSLYTARTLYVSAYGENTETANDFAKFLVSEEMQKLRYEMTKALPSIEIEVDNECVNGFLEQLNYAYQIPGITEMGEWWAPMDAATCNIWDGADVEKELKNADSAILEACKNNK